MTIKYKWLATFFIFIISASTLMVQKINAQKSVPLSNEKIITVIYPKPDQIVTAVDSTFILGNIPKLSNAVFDRLIINGTEVTVHESGGFLAFLPITPGEFRFQVSAFYYDPLDNERETYKYRLEKIMTVNVPVPIMTLRDDSLAIDREYIQPSGDLTLATGDRLKVGFIGTPGCIAWFSIDSLLDSIPMAEIAPMNQAYWGESLFGAGAVPDSVKINGIYTGYLDITSELSVESSKVRYHLSTPDYAETILSIVRGDYTNITDKLASIKFTELQTITDSSSFHLTINPPDFPFTVIFTDSMQTIRHGARKGYFAIFQPEGVAAEVIGAEGNWYKLRMSKTQTAYCFKNSVKKIGQGALPPHSYLTAVRTQTGTDNVKLEFPLKYKHPFRVIELDKKTLKIQLFGVTSDTDWIRFDLSDEYIDYASWFQVEEDLYEFTIHLTKEIWGYDSYYLGNTFVFRINYPPENLRSLSGKKIVIDPGHSKDPGSKGAAGYTEAEANLAIALILRDIFESKGAIVTMTRSDNSHVPLYDRPVIANQADADLFISVHNNALPDGVNPFENNGTATIYYHPHSISFAKAVHKELVKATGLRDFGFLHGNLAVNRPTQYPAIMVECAFMIIPEQEALLKTDKFRKKIAKSIVKGTAKFLKEFDKKNKK